MELRNLAIFLGLTLLAATQCSEARHSMKRDTRDSDYDIFAADEASDDAFQNDDDEANRTTTEPAIEQPVPAMKVITPPRVYEVKQGEDVSLECELDNRNETAVVMQWYKGGEFFFMNTILQLEPKQKYSRFYVAPDSKNLNIKAVQESDADVYKCEVVQEAASSVEHKLVVLSPPQIKRLVATNDGNVVEGANLLLTCEVTGLPPPSIVWSRETQGGNVRLTEHSDMEFSNNSLYIRGVKREHTGNYYCYVFNPAGEDQMEVSISVTGKPLVHVHKPVINSAVGVEAILECATRYEAHPHIRWYKDGRLVEDSSTEYSIITNGPRSNLTVTPRTDADFGTFTCEAANDMGSHNRSIELVQRPVVSALSAEDGRLSYTVHSHMPIHEIKAQLYPVGQEGDVKEISIPLPSEASPRYELVSDLNDKLEAGKYQAIVKVLNGHSWSENVEPVILEIDVQPSMSIQHASVFRGNAHSVKPTSVVLSSFLMYLLVRTL